MNRIYSLTAILSLLTLSACSATESSRSGEPQTFTVNSASGQNLGQLELTETRSGSTHVNVKLSGISPGLHAMHFHETGKCEAPDFKSAGGHFNPEGTDHGMKMPNGPHAGDMMNIEISADGSGELSLVNDRLSITAGGALPALMDHDGAALIIHAKADDFTSQPSGAAGPRIGCALIAAK